MTEAMNPLQDLTALVLEHLSANGARGSIDPAQVAQAWAVRIGRGSWQSCLPDVRAAAIALAQEGRLVILRKGKPVDPSNFRGVYRLGLAL